MEEKKLIPLTYDGIFLNVFLSPDKIILTERLISIILHKDINEIKGNLEIIRRELSKKNKLERNSQVDMLLKLNQTTINVELQRRYSNSIKERNVTYIFRIHSDQFKKGFKPNEINPSIQIVLNCDETYMSDRFIESKLLMDIETKEVYTDKIKINVINLPNYEKSCYPKDEEIKALSKLLLSNTWKEFMKNLGEMHMTENEKKLLKESVSDYSSDEENYDIYEEETKREWESRMVALDKYQEGIDSRNIEIAKNLLNLNVNVETISQSTGLSIDEINKLK